MAWEFHNWVWGLGLLGFLGLSLHLEGVSFFNLGLGRCLLLCCLPFAGDSRLWVLPGGAGGGEGARRVRVYRV